MTKAKHPDGTVTPALQSAAYPTLDEAVRDRRSFLFGLGAAVLATGLAACDDGASLQGGPMDGSVATSDASDASDGSQRDRYVTDLAGSQPDGSATGDSGPGDGGLGDGGTGDAPAQDDGPTGDAPTQG